MSNLTRRNMIFKIACSVCSMLFLGSCAGGENSKSEKSQSKRILPLGPVKSFKPGKTELATSRVLIHHQIVDDQHLYTATSLVCPHQGCAVRPESKGFVCPCHGAKFSEHGTVLKGPAKRDLSHLLLSVEASGELFVNLDIEVPADWKLKVDQSYF